MTLRDTVARWRKPGATEDADTAAPTSWEARPQLARLIRIVVLLGPVAFGCGAAIQANRMIAAPNSVLTALGRALLIVAIASLVVWGVDRYARKLLPLAALMQLSLVFPDQAPSRFRSALKSGSSRRLERTLEETRARGLAKDPGDAARQVIQLIGAIGDHDRRTRGHSERVRLFADLVGEELKLSKEERQKLQWGALLHDLGKLMVPSEILNKNGKPDADEWRILQGHPAEGMRLIEPLREFLGEWVHAIGGHHEKWDGSGYPAGLAGNDIPRAAAIVAVADSFEVMTAVRSYKKAMPLDEARAELTRCAGSHFSPEVVRAFLQISLGHLRIVAGPLAALAHLPFLGNIAQIPGAAAAVAPGMASAASLPAAAMMTAAALTISTPTQVSALELAQSRDAAVSQAQVSATGDATPASTTLKTPDFGYGTPGARSATTTTTTALAGVSAETLGASPLTLGAPASGDAPTTSTATTTTTAKTSVTTTTSDRWRRTTTTTTAKPASTTTVKVVTTTTAKPVTTTTAKPVTTTTAKPVTTTTTAKKSFTITVSTSGLRIPSSNLQGASYARGTKLYIYAPLSFSADKVTFTYPGGSHEASNYPYDMVTSSGLLASSWTAPSTPGTYTITAVSTTSSGSGDGFQVTATATFTIT
ncbi:MAG: HD-GYP domain-containing protein [Acidimicrobiales bacterium]